MYTLPDPQNQKRLNNLCSWDVEVMFTEIKNVFGFYTSALSLIHFIIICEQRTSWPEAEAVSHCRKAVALFPNLFFSLSLSSLMPEVSDCM